MNLKFKIIAAAAAVMIVLLAVPTLIFFPAYERFTKLERLDFDPHYTVLLGYGGNSGILVSDDPDNPATLIIDTKMMDGARALNELVGELHQGGPIYVVNTSYHLAYAGGNELYEGETIIAGEYPAGLWEAEHDEGSGRPTEWLKSGERREIKIGSETVIVKNVGQAHTHADVVVYLKKRSTLFVGGLVFHNWHPILREQSGVDTTRWNAVNFGLVREFPIRQLIPGHGAPHDGAALIFQGAYFVRIKNALAYPDRKKRLEAVKNKYGNYFSIPFTSGFDRSVDFIREELGQ